MSAAPSLATVPYTVVCHSSERERWLAARRSGIGASEAAVLVGEQKWGTEYQLWAEKCGFDVRDDEMSEAMEMGLRLEPIVIEIFGERTGMKSRGDGRLLRSIAHPWALATVDGSAIDELGDQPLEAKTTSAFLAEDWVDGAPRHYYWQAQMQMLVTGARRCYVACLIGGQKFVWDCVGRDDVAIRRLVIAGEAFWDRVVRKMPPAIDGHPNTRHAIAAVYGPGNEDEEVVLDHALAAVDEEICDLEEKAKAIASDIELRKNRLRDAIGRAGAGIVPGRARYTFRTQERRGFTVAPSSSRVLRRCKLKGVG